jgi:N-carbamoyl-L-amino-acid hydrolase
MAWGHGMATQTNLSINPRRLWDTIHDTARIGATPKGGLRRLAGSDEDRQVRDWLRAECEAAGCTVAIDRCGNMFATYPGRRSDLRPIATGSHLDTQPTGGKFDGILGVLAGLEVIRTFAETGYQTNAPLMVVNWTNEEGSRFAPAMQGSAVHAGALALEAALSASDREGITLAEALDAIGYSGAEPVRPDRFQALFELHIEQGPILEAEGFTIGAVQGVQGIRWHEVTLRGQDAHTGATPMAMRRDALCGMAAVVVALQEIGRPHAPGVASVGLVENRPNSRNVVPGEVFFTADIRHPDETVLDAMEAAFLAALAEAATANGLEVEQRRNWHSPAIAFDAELIACVKRGAERAGLATREMLSGAGHDAACMAPLVPTAMIFVPCEGGISHNESEAATLEDCGAGTQVLLNAILEYDARLA